MNVAYNEISCADAAKMLGVDYSTVTGWCRSERINCIDISDGSKNGRYKLSEDEVQYIKHLKDKFGNQFIRKYRKDWNKGKQVAEPIVEEKPKTFIKSVVTNMTTEFVEEHKKKVDIDDIAIKIGLIQDIKDKLEDLEVQKNQLNTELEELRKEVMEYL